MIYEFKSRATGSVIMTKPVAEWLLKMGGTPRGATGTSRAAPRRAASAARRTATYDERQALRAEAGEGDASAAPAQGATRDEADAYPVSLAQRAFPFIEMLEAAHKAGKDVTWGV